MKKILQNNPLFLVFVIPIIVDVVGTVLGQPTEYWTSGGKVFNEAVPFIYILLQIHPLLFIGICLAIWLPFTYWLTKKLKEPLNLWATMSLLIGHGYNSVTWLRKDLYRAGLFIGEDQLSKALSLIPMTIYILFAGWLAMKGFTLYMERNKNVKRT